MLEELASELLAAQSASVSANRIALSYVEISGEDRHCLRGCMRIDDASSRKFMLLELFADVWRVACSATQQVSQWQSPKSDAVFIVK